MKVSENSFSFSFLCTTCETLPITLFKNVSLMQIPCLLTLCFSCVVVLDDIEEVKSVKKRWIPCGIHCTLHDVVPPTCIAGSCTPTRHPPVRQPCTGSFTASPAHRSCHGCVCCLRVLRVCMPPQPGSAHFNRYLNRRGSGRCLCRLRTLHVHLPPYHTLVRPLGSATTTRNGQRKA